ncbi:hypothetical protein F5X68DRAFT_237480 [Plectosphaerella plurivora]|uniref:DUF7600 domain-containing protein n=1 Tax=Plectosphaerella plurivora TaxID=936078 RepID=A0A9P8V1D1_9PEZI|nr:hypothetical protein F5X68DRAFT_237480 [Plectosphaerella plurivora]
MRNSVCEGDVLRSVFDMEYYEIPSHLKEKAMNIARTTFDIEREEAVLRQRGVALPLEGATAVFVSFIEVFGRRYVSGIRIVDGQGQSQTLGYRRSATEVLLDCPNPGSRIKGFGVARDRDGIRGLAVIDESGAMSRWQGEEQVTWREDLMAPDWFDLSFVFPQRLSIPSLLGQSHVARPWIGTQTFPAQIFDFTA